MTTSPTRRVLTGLAPRTATDPGLGRLIRANREGAPLEQRETTKKAQPQENADSETNRLPKYLTFRRREARMYEEQADALTLLARRINAERRRPDGTTEGERITDNTLLRLAIDLLLERSDDLRGTTEAELATSLGLSPRTEA